MSKFSICFACVLCLLSFSFCFAGQSYFNGLAEQGRGEKQRALKDFKKSVDKGNSVESYAALKKIFDQLSAEEKLSYSKKAVKNCRNLEPGVYNYYVQALLENKDYSSVIETAAAVLDENTNSSIDASWLLYCKAVANLKLNFEKSKVYSFDDESVIYFLTQIPYSKYHEKFREEFSSEMESSYKDFRFFEFRHFCFIRHYGKAYACLECGFDELDYGKMSSTQISELGRCLGTLSGTIDFVKAAECFEKNAEKKYASDQKFYLYFYSARFYRKAGRNFTDSAKKNYLLAMKNSSDGKQYDNALWYYLNLLKKESFESMVAGMKEYGKTFCNKSYYSDLFEEMIQDLLSQRKWSYFYSLYPVIDSYAADSVKAYYYYIAGRLLQENMVASTSSFSKKTPEDFFNAVVNLPEVSLYYSLLSFERLGTKPDDAIKLLIKNQKFESPDKKKTKEIVDFMKDCIKNKNVKELYSVCIAYKNYLDSEDLVHFAKEANSVAHDNPSAIPYALRIATYALNAKGTGKNRDLFELCYPRYFYKDIKKYCKEYSLEEDLMLGLIRSESYFDKNIVSKAGAVGLCQLMPSTAGDIARKLKIKEYDLKDAETNIQFGTFYIAELIRRLDGSVMSAIISYNSGISRVRKWHKKYSDVPIDIFMEMLPIEESRGYGKKVLSASVIFGFLYYDKSSEEIISALIR